MEKYRKANCIGYYGYFWGLSACGMTCKKGVQVINNKYIPVPGALNSRDVLILFA